MKEKRRGPAMDFYEALHSRNLTHRASRPHFDAT
jgi:hypothetical protein